MKRGDGMAKKNAFLMTIMAAALTLTLMIAAPLYAKNEGKLSAAVDRESAPVGSVVTLTLRYDLPENSSLPPQAEIKGLEGFTTLGSSQKPGQIDLKILIDRLDTLKTDKISLSYLDPEKKSRQLETDGFSVKVIPRIGADDKAELKPLQSITPTTRSRLALMLILSAFAVVLLGALFFLWRRRAGRNVAAAAGPVIPADVVARAELERLDRSELFETGRVKEFYFRFSAILKQYLEATRGFPAAEYTTEEIAARIDREVDRSALSLLRQADVVKFADDMPTRARKQDDMLKAYAYIGETGAPKEQETEAAKSQGEAR